MGNLNMMEIGTWMKDDEIAKQVALIVDQFMAQWTSREWKAPDAPAISSPADEEPHGSQGSEMVWIFSMLTPPRFA